MQYNDFMTAITDIYGDYKSEILEQITVKYIRERFKEPELDKVMSTLLLKLNPKYKTPPSPADFEEIFFAKSDRDYEAEAHEWWNTLTRTGCSLDDVVISDLRAQACIEDFGGWAEFCQRDPQYESLHQQKFTKWFIMYSHKLPDREAKVLLGDSTRRREPLMFGLKDECKAIAMSARPEGSVLQLADTLTRDMRIGNEH